MNQNQAKSIVLYKIFLDNYRMILFKKKMNLQVSIEKMIT